MKNTNNLRKIWGLSIFVLIISISASPALAQITNGDDDVGAGVVVTAGSEQTSTLVGSITNGDDDVGVGQTTTVDSAANLPPLRGSITNGDDDVLPPPTGHIGNDDDVLANDVQAAPANNNSNTTSNSTVNGSITNGDDDVGNGVTVQGNTVTGSLSGSVTNGDDDVGVGQTTTVDSAANLPPLRGSITNGDDDVSQPEIPSTGSPSSSAGSSTDAPRTTTFSSGDGRRSIPVPTVNSVIVNSASTINPNEAVPSPVYIESTISTDPTASDSISTPTVSKRGLPLALQESTDDNTNVAAAGDSGILDRIWGIFLSLIPKAHIEVRN